MAFDPSPGTILPIEEVQFAISEHPAAPGMPYGQEGRAAVVYQLVSGAEARALKVFKSRFRTPQQTSLSGRLAPYAALPGLAVCRRTVLTPQHHKNLLRQFPDLTYAISMPWISGPTWMQVMEERTCLEPQQSLALAHAFATILAEMEQQGLAHCDLSAANILLPALAPQGKGMAYADIEIVDVEQLYAPGFDMPEAMPSGSDGYAHRSVRQEKIWNNKTDRFAGALLLAEMLAWCAPAVRSAAWGQSYFEPAELQHPSRRFDCLRTCLQIWSPQLGELLDRAWNSSLLADCPTFGEWLVALPDDVPAAPQQAQPPRSPDTGGGSSVAPVLASLMAAGKRLADQGDRTGAQSVYREALNLAPKGSTHAAQLEQLLQALQQPETPPLPAAPTPAEQTGWVSGHRQHAAWLSLGLLGAAFVAAVLMFGNWIGWLGSGAFWISLVLFAIFPILYTRYAAASYRNVQAMQVQGLRYSPRQAFWWMFVPLVNLVLPFLIQQEIWKASDPTCIHGQAWKKSQPSALLAAIWSMTVLISILLLFTPILFPLLFIALPMACLAVILAVAFINSLAARQAQKAAALVHDRP